MSRENVELVGQAVEAFNSVGMAEAARRFFHPDGVFEEPPEQPTPTVAQGRDEAVRIFEQFDAMWENHRTEVEEIRGVEDDRVLLLSIEHFRGRDGIEIAQPCGSVYTFRDGQIVRLQPFWDRENALRAAGQTPVDRRERFEATLALINARDFDSLAEGLTGEVEFRSVIGAVEGAGAYTGIDGLRAWAEGVDAVWEDWHQEIVDFREVSEHVAVMTIRATGRARGSGVPLDIRTGNVLTERPGEGFQLVAYSDPREAFEAVGLKS